jgi:hypothetical protein
VTAAARAEDGEGQGRAADGVSERGELLKSADPALAAYLAMKKAEAAFGKRKRGTGRDGGVAGKAGGVGKRRVGGEFVGEEEGGMGAGGGKGVAGAESVSGDYLRDSRFSLL